MVNNGVKTIVAMNLAYLIWGNTNAAVVCLEEQIVYTETIRAVPRIGGQRMCKLGYIFVIIRVSS